MQPMDDSNVIGAHRKMAEALTQMETAPSVQVAGGKSGLERFMAVNVIRGRVNPGEEKREGLVEVTGDAPVAALL